MKPLGSLAEFRKAINLHSILADNVSNMLRLLDFFVKIFSFRSSIIYSNVYTTFSFLFNILVNLRVLLLRLPLISILFLYGKRHFLKADPTRTRAQIFKKVNPRLLENTKHVPKFTTMIKSSFMTIAFSNFSLKIPK